MKTKPTTLGDLDRSGLLTVLARVRGFRKDRKGIAAIEFAMIAPFMIALWLGSIELSQGVSIDRKVSHAASALADLVTQQTNLTPAEVEDIMDATTAILAPFDVGNLRIEMAGVEIDDDGDTEVLWGVARNGTAPARGGSYAVPAALAVPDTFLVAARLVYTHTPATTHVITGAIDLEDSFFLRPRRSDEITCPAC